MTSAVRWRIFVCAAAVINLIAFSLVRIVPRAEVAFGAAVDVAVTVPLLYLLLIVRGGLQPIFTAVPLFLLGLLRATYLAPGASVLRPAIGAAAEIAITALIVVRVKRGLRAGRTGDVLENLEAAAVAVVPSRRLAAVLVTELAVFYYAFGTWRRSAGIPDGTRAFTVHEQSGVAVLFGMLAGVSVIEAALVHLVVGRNHPAAAWGLTAISAYGCIWLVAMARALVLRPLLVDAGQIVLRSGIMWTLHVPRGAIESLDPAGAQADLRIPPASDANVVVHFREPVVARGMYGITRRVTSVAIAVDDPAAFTRALIA